MAGKSERLRKLEEELSNLEQWVKLGLVPKNDSDKFHQEMEEIKAKISDEKEKIQIMKESGQIQEFVANKRVNARAGYAENPTVAEIDSIDDRSDLSDSSYQSSTDSDSTFSHRKFDKDSSDNTYNGSEEDYDDMGDDYTKSMRQKNRNRYGFIDPDDENW